MLLVLIQPVDVGGENPYENDLLNRKPFIAQLKNLITSDENSLILGLNGAWGTGKSTVIRFLESELIADGHVVVILNAWQDDFISDPLVAIIGSLVASELFSKELIGEEFIKSLKKFSVKLLRITTILGASRLTHGQYTSEELKEIFEGNSDETQLLELYEAERKSLQQLQDILGAITKKLQDSNLNLILIIDELDRCKPTYAIALFERIKHVFEASNLRVLMSFDQKQLEATVKNYYGQEIDASRYLEKMFDLVINLPSSDLYQMLINSIKKLSIPEPHSYSGLREQYDILTRSLLSLFNATHSSPRELERTMIRVKFLLNRSQGLRVDPMFAVVLMIIRNQNPYLFERIKKGISNFGEIDTFFKQDAETMKIWQDGFSDYVEALCFVKQDHVSERSDFLSMAMGTTTFTNMTQEQQMKRQRMESHVSRVKDDASGTIPQMAQAVEVIFNSVPN